MEWFDSNKPFGRHIQKSQYRLASQSESWVEVYRKGQIGGTGGMIVYRGGGGDHHGSVEAKLFGVINAANGTALGED